MLNNNSNLFSDFVREALTPVIIAGVRQALREERESTEKKVYPSLLSVKDVSELTGYKPNSIYQYHSANRIPGAKRIGGKLWFDKDVIIEWAKNGATLNRATYGN